MIKSCDSDLNWQHASQYLSGKTPSSTLLLNMQKASVREIIMMQDYLQATLTIHSFGHIRRDMDLNVLITVP